MPADKCRNRRPSHARRHERTTYSTARKACCAVRSGRQRERSFRLKGRSFRPRLASTSRLRLSSILRGRRSSLHPFLHFERLPVKRPCCILRSRAVRRMSPGEHTVTSESSRHVRGEAPVDDPASHPLMDETISLTREFVHRYWNGGTSWCAARLSDDFAWMGAQDDQSDLSSDSFRRQMEQIAIERPRVVLMCEQYLPLPPRTTVHRGRELPGFRRPGHPADCRHRSSISC